MTMGIGVSVGVRVRVRVGVLLELSVNLDHHFMLQWVNCSVNLSVYLHLFYYIR